jgi:hypothetical protein
MSRVGSVISAASPSLARVRTDSSRAIESVRARFDARAVSVNRKTKTPPAITARALTAARNFSNVPTLRRAMVAVRTAACQ